MTIKVKDKVKLTPKELRGLYEIAHNEMELNGLTDDWLHGWPHIKRMEELLKDPLLKFCPKIARSKYAMMLHVAIIFQNVKKGVPGDHAEEAAKFFRQLKLKIKGLTKTHIKYITFAIRNHSKGLRKCGVKQARWAGHILLGLLEFLNSMDYIGITGERKIEQWYLYQNESIDFFGKQYSIEELKRAMYCEDVDFEAMNLREQKAVLPHLVFELCMSRNLAKPLLCWLSAPFLYKYDTRRQNLERRILELMQYWEEKSISKQYKYVPER